VSIDDCRRVSQDLNTLPDVEDDLGGSIGVRRWRSSSGLDRKLRGGWTTAVAGRLAKMVTREPVGGQSHFAGRLAGVEMTRCCSSKGERTGALALIDRAAGGFGV
jgi:ribosome maturation factor RimP